MRDSKKIGQFDLQSTIQSRRLLLYKQNIN